MAARPTEQEVCPLCGNFTDQLNEFTGWCVTCTPLRNPLAESTERWLTRHADQLETYMLQGNSFTQSKKLVYDDERPICLSCNKPIKGGKANQHFFCTVYSECRKAQRRYRTLRERWQRNGYETPDARKYALEQIVREIGERTDGVRPANTNVRVS